MRPCRTRGFRDLESVKYFLSQRKLGHMVQSGQVHGVRIEIWQYLARVWKRRMVILRKSMTGQTAEHQANIFKVITIVDTCQLATVIILKSNKKRYIRRVCVIDMCCCCFPCIAAIE